MSDTKGPPTRVYHGPQGIFDEFTTGFEDSGAMLGRGYYFTESPPIAGGYAETKGFQNPITGAYEGAPNIHATYLNLQNPLYLEKGRKKDVVDKMADKIFDFAKGSPTVDYTSGTVSDSFGKLAGDTLDDMRADSLRAFSHNLYNRSSDWAFDPDDFLDDIGINAYNIDNFIDNRQWDEAESELRKWFMEVTQTNADTEFIVNDFFRYNQDPSQIWGKEVWTNGLEELGYDGITHIGKGSWGQGGTEHRVWIVFDEKHIFPFSKLEGMKPELPPSGDFAKMLKDIFGAGMGR